MTWELYEVWAEEDDGHERLVDTTKSRKEAISLAKKTVNEGAVLAKVFRETADGDYEEIDTIKSD
jgi:hypothetical protein